MKSNKLQKPVIQATAQIRISDNLAKSIKVSAAANKMSMVEMANLLISTGIGLLKKK